MDFSLSDDQVQLGDAIKRFCEGEYPREKRGDAVTAELRSQRWSVMAELGLIGLTLDEEHGGMAQGMVEQVIVTEELGRCLSPEPYLSNAVIAAGLIAELGTASQCGDWLGGIAEGRCRLALALYEAGARDGLDGISCQAERSGDGWVLCGSKRLVLDGTDADAFLVVAKADDGIALFILPRDSEGLSIAASQTLDARDLAELQLDRVQVPSGSRLGSGTQAETALERALDRANVALCGEAVGAMAELLDQTSEYLKVRKQFGAPLAKFQALQHRIVDALIALEQSRSMAALAAMAIDEGEADQRRSLVSAAKVQICRASRRIAKEAIQMHGAMGMTEECRVGHYVKRLMVIETLFGDAQYHLERFAH